MLSNNINSQLSGVFSPSANSSQGNQPLQPGNLVSAVPIAITEQPVIPATQVVQSTSPVTAGIPVLAQNTNSVDDALQQILARPPQSKPDLDLLEAVIEQAEKTVPQALPAAMLQVADEQKAAELAKNPVVPTQGGKEAIGRTTSPDNSLALETGSNIQVVEYEPNPELPPEVEGYINKVEQNMDQAPKEIVIADATMPPPSQHQLPSQPVIVLPITPEIEKQGIAKSPKFSIRWLVEWSRKIIKIFVGKVIYRQN